MNEEFRICQLADDTTLFISNMKSVIASVTILHRFAKYSGLKINLEKSTIIPIGSCTNKQTNLPKEIKQLCVSHAVFKTLGIWFSYDQKEMTKLNFEKKLASIEKTLQIWSSRRLSLKGKVSIIKTLVILKIVYALSLIFCPTKILEKLDKILFSFLWDNKTPKIKRETIIANYCDGGLKMTDVFLVHESAKIRFLKRILKSDNMKWTKPTWYLLNIEKHQINHKTPAYYTEQCKTEFHCQVLKCWQKIKCRPPSSIEEIMNEYIFDNKYISCNGKPLDHKLFKSSTILSDDLRLKSLLDNNGHIQTFQQLKHKFDWKLNIHMYNTLITSIPKLWKQKLKGSPPSMNMQSEIYISRKGHLLSIAEVSNQQLYLELLRNEIKEPTAVNTWTDLFPLLECVSWKLIFSATHHITLETYLQTFQYKILNRLINFNFNLYKWKIKSEPYCDSCVIAIDTIEHHLFLCPLSKKFWEEMEVWLNKQNNMPDRIQFTICEVIFGIGINQLKTSFYKFLNIFILFGKHYLNFCRTDKKNTNFVEFLSIAKSRIKYYKIILQKSVANNNKVIR